MNNNPLNIDDLKHSCIQASCAGKIACIKLLRDYINLDLVEAKNIIERLERTCSVKEYPNILEATIKAHIHNTNDVPQRNTLSKEEILELISTALDAGESMFYKDPFEVVKQLCENILRQGGAQIISNDIEHMIDNL